MGRLTLLVLFGGCSEEHPVSVKSARQVAAALDRAAYDPLFVGITQAGAWRLCDDPVTGWEVDSAPAFLSPDRDVPGLLVCEQGSWRTERVDVAFPVLHGRFGEDGVIQGLLELSGIPYVGCGVQSSVLCMDKSLAYLVAGRAGIATPEHVVVARDEDVDPDGLAYPVFVKPARSGSSFGVTKAAGPAELPGAVAAARRYDTKVLIEQAVAGREVGCGVVGNDGEVFVGEPDRVALSHGFFRIHQEDTPELGSENASFVVPADISAGERARVQQTARALYGALGCRGLARIDLFLLDDGTVVLNEVNTMPGLTSYSRFPRMMAAAGLPLGAVIDRVVALALDTP